MSDEGLLPTLMDSPAATMADVAALQAEIVELRAELANVKDVLGEWRPRWVKPEPGEEFSQWWRACCGHD